MTKFTLPIQCRTQRNIMPESSSSERNRLKREDAEPSRQTFIEKARKAQIIDAASRLFVEKGFTNTSMEDIAQCLGVSRGVLFYYFEGKTAIGEEALRVGVHSYVDYVQSRVGRKRTARTKLREFTEACLDYQAEHTQLYIVLIELLGGLGENEDKYRLTRSLNQRTRTQLMNIISEGIANGEFSKVDSHTLADIIQAFIDGMMAMTAMEPDTVNIGKVKRMWQRILDDAIA